MGRGDSSAPSHEDAPAVPGELPVRLLVNGVLRELRLGPRVVEAVEVFGVPGFNECTDGDFPVD